MLGKTHLHVRICNAELGAPLKGMAIMCGNNGLLRLLRRNSVNLLFKIE
jgi:hypothetical protein